MALYRKYRPATFAEVVGQEHVTEPLSTALDTGRISHAYLFSGPRGCGKTSSARILARSLNCAQGPTSRPCGVCSSCVALAPGGPGNLDVIELDAASHGGVDDTRELRDRAFYTPAESRYRVFIVDEAHMVTTAGFNALLKIVEEPPAHLIFVFATTEPDKVLPTIRSRTHHYPFRLLPPATMRGLLGTICEQEQVLVEEAVYPLVIRAGGGSPRDSLSVLDQLLAGAGPEGVTYPRALALLGVTDIALIDDAVEALVAEDGATLFGTVDRVVEAGHDPRRFAGDLLDRMRDLILLRAVPDAAERNLVTGPGDVLERMRDQAHRLGPAALARYAELLHTGLGEMRGATAPRLLLEVICARMLLPVASDAESATLQRLERLERQMAGGAVAPAAPSSSARGPASAAQGSGPAQGSAERDSAAPGSTASQSGPPRRRGAEALAAMRESRGDEPGASRQPADPEPGSTRPVQPAGPMPAAAPQPDTSASPASGASQEDSSAPMSPDPAGFAFAPGAPPVDVSEDAAAQVGSPDAAPAAPCEPVAAVPGDDQVPPHSSTEGLESTGTDAAAPAAPPADVPRPETDPRPPMRDPGVADVEPAGARVGDPARMPEAVEPVSAGVGEPLSGDSDSERVPQDGPAAEVPDTSGPTGAGQEPVESPDGSGDAGAPGTSGASGSDALREIEAAWGDIRSKVRESGAAVHALLSGASVARLEGDTVVLAHQHAPLAQRLANPKYVEAVQSAMQAVLGRPYGVRWEVGAGGPAGGRAEPPNKQPGTPGRGAAPRQAEPPKFTRPSRARGAAPDTGAAPSGGQAPGGQSGQTPATGSVTRATPPDDDIPLPDGPDLPDDPGPTDYSPVGYDGVPPASTPEEEQEMLAESASPVPQQDRRDPDDVALELLSAELGATRLEA